VAEAAVEAAVPVQLVAAPEAAARFAQLSYGNQPA